MKLSTIVLAMMILVMALAACSGSSHNSVIHRPAEGAIGPYSGSVTVGDTCYVAGKIAPDLHANGPFADEVHAVIDAIESELARSGCSLSDVVNSTVYLTEMSLFDEFNRVYGERFVPPYPARTTVGVSRLPASRRVEIAVVAHCRK